MDKRDILESSIFGVSLQERKKPCPEKGQEEDVG